MSIRTEYRCNACNGGTFIIPAGPDKLVHSCPYCGNWDSLAINAMIAVPCDITAPDDDNTTLTPEQKEMALYERAVDVLGLGAVSARAIQALACLTSQLVEINAVLKSPDCTGMDYTEELTKLNSIKADVAISINLLDVLFGSNPEEECRMLKELECSVDAADECAAVATEYKAVAATMPEDPTT